MSTTVDNNKLTINIKTINRTIIDDIINNSSGLISKDQFSILEFTNVF